MQQRKHANLREFMFDPDVTPESLGPIRLNGIPIMYKEYALDKVARMPYEERIKAYPKVWSDDSVALEVYLQDMEPALKALQTPLEDEEVPDGQQLPPLHEAAARGHEVVVKHLLVNGVPTDSRDWLQRTPLHMACKGGHRGVVELLLLVGALRMPEDARGFKPAHYAMANRHLLVWELVIFSNVGLHHHIRHVEQMKLMNATKAMANLDVNA